MNTSMRWGFIFIVGMLFVFLPYWAQAQPARTPDGVRDSIGYEQFKNYLYTDYQITNIKAKKKRVTAEYKEGVKVLGLISGRVTTTYSAEVNDDGNFDFSVSRPFWHIVTNAEKIGIISKRIKDTLDTTYVPAEFQDNESRLRAVLLQAFADAV